MDAYDCQYNLDIVLPFFEKGQIKFGCFDIDIDRYNEYKISLSKGKLENAGQKELAHLVWLQNLSIDEAIEADSRDLIDVALDNIDRHLEENDVKYFFERRSNKGNYMSRAEIKKYHSEWLTDLLETLNSSMKNYYYLVIKLIDRGAYVKEHIIDETGYAEHINIVIKDEFQTAFVYRVAQDMMKLENA